MRWLLPASVLALVFGFAACGSKPQSSTTGDFGGAASTSSSSGAGGLACPGASMMACSGACVDTSSDPKNCGDCGNDCMGALCCASTCVTTAACSFAVTGFDSNQSYLNGGDWVILQGSGFAPGMKVFFGAGRAPTLVLDGTKARVQVPPGLLGAVDVSVTLGAESATLKGKYSYVKGGLTTPWQQKPLTHLRGEDPGVAVMQDGRVLVAGGTTVPDSTMDALDTAEVYTRSTDAVVELPSKMSTPRWQNSAVTMMDGRVLVVGGACYDDGTHCVGDPTQADVFTPGVDTFAKTKKPLNVQRMYTRTVLLPDGRVFIASANDPSIEIYDPANDDFTLIPATQPHVFGFVVRLKDGRVLLGGGDGGITAAEVFDPDTNMLTSVGPMQQGRSMLTAHTMPDGKVLVIGGSSMSAGSVHIPLDSMEIFDPKTGAFALAPYKLSIGRTWHASALVRDGTVLAMGGYTVQDTCDGSDDTVDQIDELAGMVKPFAKLPNKNTEWVAVTLLDGSVLGVGGGACGQTMALPDLDFLPGSDQPN